jgi:hypothetical protein
MQTGPQQIKRHLKSFLIFFTLYMAPLQSVISRHELSGMFHTDDTQLYNAVNPNNLSIACETLRRCIDDVILWNADNFLLSNPSKTEVIHLTSRFHKSHNPRVNFSLAGTNIQVSDKVRDLGVILDKKLNVTNKLSTHQQIRTRDKRKLI